MAFSYSAPVFCQPTSDNKDYLYRMYYYTTDTATGVTFTFIQDNTAIPVLAGNLTLSEGVYYSTIMGVAWRSGEYSSITFECPLDNYWSYYNAPNTPSLNRF